MVIKLENLLDFFKSSLSEIHFGQLKHLKKQQDLINAEEFLSWARSTKNLKITSYDIPSSILKNSKLHDIKIDSRGPDDKVYDKNEELRLKVARGNSILETDENGKINHKLVIYALRKFTGGLGDEDELDRNSKDWKNYFIRDFSHVRQVFSLQKANGEAAHFSCSWIDGEFLLCSGSKNVHLVFKNKNDLMNFTEQRFSYAKIISETILNFLNRLDTDLKIKFLSFLCLFNLTVVFEILNPDTQHVEDLSYLTEPLLMFITFTSNVIDPKPNSLCSMAPDCAIQIANLFKLNTVKMEIVDHSSIEDHLCKIRKDHSYEGVVLYFLDSEFNVIGLLKKKTAWYIIVRAIREKLRYHTSPKNNASISELETRVKSRLKSIQNWIGFSDKECDQWLALLTQFCQWFDEGFKKNLISRDDFSNKFPVLWTKFLDESSLTDKIEISINKNENPTINNLNENIEKMSFN